MPYRSERIPIAGTKLDLRRKLSEEQKQAVTVLYERGFSQRKIAAMFGCSKGTIQQLVAPHQKSKPKRYSSEYWAAAKKRYRTRKQELLKAGDLDAVHKLKK